MFDVKFVFLWTDAVLWLLVLGLIGYVVYVLRTEELARKWRKVLNNKTAVAAAAVLSVFCALLGILASILAGTPVGSTIVAVQIGAFGLSWLAGTVLGGVRR